MTRVVLKHASPSSEGQIHSIILVLCTISARNLSQRLRYMHMRREQRNLRANTPYSSKQSTRADDVTISRDHQVVSAAVGPSELELYSLKHRT